MVKLIAIGGSARTGSFNQMLVQIAASAAKNAGADVEIIHLRDFDIPLYDGDLEEKSGIPEGAKKLRELMEKADGFLIASPEYNSSVSGYFKNAIDWVSRPDAKLNIPSLVAFKGKCAAIMSASPGNLGGLRGLVHLRSILENIGVIVLPNQVTVAEAHTAFDEKGQIKSEHKLKAINALGKELAEFTKKVCS